MEKVRLNELVADRLHQPRVNGLPIYARVDGAAEVGDGRTGNKPDDWAKVVTTRRNSPDNVRRVFITYKGVYVHYYKPITGVKSNSLKSEKAYKDGINMLEVKNNIDNRTGVYAVNGTGIQAIVKPWVCSNIEEIYFDWTLLLSDEVRNMFGITQPQQVSEGFIQEFFKTACCKDTKDISSRFPRLRAVGYIHNLEEVYRRVPEKPGMDSIEDIKMPWSLNELVKSEKKAGRAHLWFVNSKELNEAYSLKPNIYVFDNEVLSVHFDELLKRIDKYKAEKVAELKGRKQPEPAQQQAKEQAQPAQPAQQQVQPKETKKEFEQMLDRLYELGGMEEVQRAIKISMNHFKKSERMAIYNELTQSGKERYGVCMGLSDKKAIS